jgi:hypothetical protein
MVRQVRLELDYEAIARLTQDVIEEKTQEIAGRAGEGYTGDVIWTDRPHGAVRATTIEARLDNARHNTLLKAAQGG